MFQNAWAMEQTFLVFCDGQETSQEIEQHDHDENSTTEHDHSVCNNCCHLSTPLVVINEFSNTNNYFSAQQYDILVLNNLKSILNKPSTPPPIG